MRVSSNPASSGREGETELTQAKGTACKQMINTQRIYPPRPIADALEVGDPLATFG
ncbi:hypothetical protein [Paraburkholderia kirstenboschensis]|uniref:hypothetical protein n=1 Tax=Paraburkholderia kirstenboschensis TaxID=1245436 RepID=UPI000AF3761B|nr:hypothetical protein [Paraburkholderia kirstenboschensis]